MIEEHDTDTGAENEDISAFPDEAADPQQVVESKILEDIRDQYENYSYRNAAIILAESRTEEFNDLLTALREFGITTRMIRTAGGNESKIPKIISQTGDIDAAVPLPRSASLNPVFWSLGEALDRNGDIDLKTCSTRRSYMRYFLNRADEIQIQLHGQMPRA